MMLNRAFRPARLAAALLLAAATLPAAPNDKPVNWNGGIPEPYHTESATNRPKMVERPAGAELKLPDGFQVEEFAVNPDWVLASPHLWLVWLASVYIRVFIRTKRTYMFA